MSDEITTKFAEAVADFVKSAPLVAVADTTYVPSAAVAGDVTCSVVEALAPGAIVNSGEAKAAVQPDGTTEARLIALAAQAALSVLIA